MVEILLFMGYFKSIQVAKNGGATPLFQKLYQKNMNFY